MDYHSFLNVKSETGSETDCYLTLDPQNEVQIL